MFAYANIFRCRISLLRYNWSRNKDWFNRFGLLILATARNPQLLEIKFSIKYFTAIKVAIVMGLIRIHLYLIFIDYSLNKDNKFEYNKIKQYKTAGILDNNLSLNLKGIAKF
jgi:hypothetical protein